MAKFTTFDAPIGVAAGNGGRAASAADMGGGSEGLLKAGRTLKKAGDIVVRKEEATSKAQVDLAYTEGRSQWMEELQNRQDTAEAGAQGFTEKFKTDYDAYVDKQLNAEHLTDTSRAYMKQRLEGLRGTFIGQSVAFESKSGAKMRRDAVEGGLDADVNIAYGNMGMYQEGLDSGLGRIAGTKVNGDIKADIEKGFRNDIAHKALLGELKRDPEKVLDRLKGTYWQTQLTDTAFAQISSAASSKLAIQDAKALTEQNKANSAARAGVRGISDKYENGFIPTTLESKEVASLVKSSSDPDIKNTYSDLQAFSGRLNEMKGMHTTELRSFIDVLPKPGEAVTDLQLMTIQAGNKLLGRKETADTTLLGDLTAEVKKVTEGGGKVSDTTVILMSELLKGETDRSTATGAQEVLVAAQTQNGLRADDMTQGRVNSALAGVIAAADADEVRTVSETAQIDVATRFAENMNKVLTNEGALSWYQGRTDVVIDNLDMGAVASMEARFQTAKTLKKRSGAEKYQFFLPHELSDLQEKLPDMTAPARVQMYRSMQLAGGNEAYKAFAEISDKGSPLMGYVAGMASNPDPRFGVLAMEIEQGNILMSEQGGSQRIPPTEKLKKSFDRVIGNAIGPRAPKGLRAGMMDAFKALYVGRGLPSTNISTADADKLVKEVAGADIISHNNSKVLLPIGVDKDKFESAVKRMTAEDIALAAAPIRNGARGPIKPLTDSFGDPVRASTLWNKGQFEYAGPNKYRVRKQGNNQYVFDTLGNPAIFDFTEVLKKAK